MELLSPNDIQKAKRENEQETRKRTTALAEEESRLVKILNRVRNETEETIKQIDADFAVYIKEKREQRQRIQIEIEKLQADRAELLVPITEIKKEAEAKIVELDTREANLATKEKLMEENKEKLAELAESIKDKQDELVLLENELQKKQAFIDSELERVRESGKDLADKYIQYHTAVNMLNEKIVSIERREKQLEIEHTTNQKWQESLRQKEAELVQKDRQIYDKYTTLERAIEEHKKQGVQI